MKVIPKVGDVFLIPLDQKFAVGGYVISIREEAELYLAIMGQRTMRERADPQSILAETPALLTLSFDGKLHNGDWPIIGNLPDAVDHYPQPAFKIRRAGTTFVESRDKRVRRPATKDELDFLQNRSVASPMIVEDAIRAHLGLSEWNDSYGKRLADYALKSSKLV